MTDFSKFSEMAVQKFLRENLAKNPHEVSMLNSPFQSIKSSELAQQLKGLQVAKAKFPNFFQNVKIVYPPSLNLEQSSSETTALYKSSLVSGKKFIDMTAGFGIDSLAFSSKFEKVILIEQNENLAKILSHNFKALHIQNAEIISGNFESYLSKNQDLKLDLIYIDPSRRKGSLRKFLLSELEPDVLNWMTKFLEISPKVMIKLSPLLDIKSTIDELKFIQEIHIVSVKNEVKELLIIGSQNENLNPKMIAVNLSSGQPDFVFNFSDEQNAEVNYSKPLKYIYEPNVSILKSGGFKIFAQRFGLMKLHPNTHLYTSENLISPIPAKIFEVQSEIKSPKEIPRGNSFHVISKNYPSKVEEIRKKYDLREDENQTLIFTQSISGKQILFGKRIL